MGAVTLGLVHAVGLGRELVRKYGGARCDCSGCGRAATAVVRLRRGCGRAHRLEELECRAPLLLRSLVRAPARLRVRGATRRVDAGRPTELCAHALLARLAQRAGPAEAWHVAA
eukprot:4447639-Prymnesium_polylepis.1